MIYLQSGKRKAFKIGPKKLTSSSLGTASRYLSQELFEFNTDEPFSGAGVAAFTTALALAENPDYHVTIVAQYMPSDEAADHTSLWAGASYLP